MGVIEGPVSRRVSLLPDGCHDIRTEVCGSHLRNRGVTDVRNPTDDYSSSTKANVNPLLRLVEASYVRHAPRRVAFVGSANYGVAVGHPPRLGGLIEGFDQRHSGDTHTSLYSSYFRWDKFLIAEFECFAEEQPSPRQWIAFVRLAARVQRFIDDAAGQPDTPTADVPALKPQPTGPKPRPLGVEAPVEEGSD